jgi:hypothetical protein
MLAAKVEHPRIINPSKAPSLKVTSATVAELKTLTGGIIRDNNASDEATIMACILPRIIYAAKKFTESPAMLLFVICVRHKMGVMR